jgi:deoxyribodipyrimidine photo-lyase
VFEEIRRNHGIAQLWSHEETGNWLSYQRDRAVRKWAKESGVAFTEIPGNGVVRRLKSRDGWSKQWEARMTQQLTPAPERLLPVAAESLPLPEVGVSPQVATRQAALNTLDSFLAARGVNYTREMSSPVSAESACSRLSAYLAWGQISMREVLQAARRQLADLRGDDSPEGKLWRRSIGSFDARLHWHCHFMQKLEDEPRLEFENMVRSFDGLREDQFDEERFEAWKAGLTGYPFIDACMRYLRETGWINFRMRAMLVSFSSYHLWLHWRKPSLYLAQLFLDYEPGIHYSQFQMQSGTTGMNTLRIYSPVKQSMDQDPSGEFIRRWVPELAAVPKAFIHTPWKWPELSGYPAPVVDHAEAVKLARERLAEFRRRSGTRTEIQAVAKKHGSRKKPTKRRPATKQKKLF